MAAPKNVETAKALLALCEARQSVAKGIDAKKYPALVAEAHYEIVKEMITALLALEGFKCYSHVCLIAFVREYHAKSFSEAEIEIMDKLRKIRNDIGYRGVFTGADFVERNEKAVHSIIKKLDALVRGKIE